MADRNDTPPATTGVTAVEVIDLLSCSDGELMERFGAWYIPRREPRYLRRNALVVLGNVGDPSSTEVRQLVERYVASTDEVEREHAMWAAEQLGYDDLVTSMVE